MIYSWTNNWDVSQLAVSCISQFLLHCCHIQRVEHHDQAWYRNLQWWCHLFQIVLLSSEFGYGQRCLSSVSSTSSWSAYENAKAFCRDSDCQWKKNWERGRCIAETLLQIPKHSKVVKCGRVFAENLNSDSGLFILGWRNTTWQRVPRIKHSARNTTASPSMATATGCWATASINAVSLSMDTCLRKVWEHKKHVALRGPMQQLACLPSIVFLLDMCQHYWHKRK